MIKRSKKYPHAFYERGSWYHRTKILKDDYTVEYGKVGGFNSDKEAEDAYKHHIEEFDRKMKASLIRQNNDTTLKEYLVYWYQSIFSERIKSTTKCVAGYAIYNLLLPYIDDDISLRMVTTEYLDNLLRRASRCCDSAGNKAREVLYIAMKDAVIHRMLSSNPVEGTKRYPRKKPKIKILTTEETKIFLEAAKYRSWFLEILLALYCGLRKGEILGLKFSDFDLKRGTVHIQRQLVADVKLKDGQFAIQDYTLVTRDPKSMAGNREFKVPSIILVELEKRRKQIELFKDKMGDDFIDSGYISCQHNGLPHGLSSLNNEIGRLCSRNNLPHMTVHGLRHMFATIMMERNLSMAKISGLLSHSSVHTTFEFYLEVMDADTKMMEYMNKEFVYSEE